MAVSPGPQGLSNEVCAVPGHGNTHAYATVTEGTGAVVTLGHQPVASAKRRQAQTFIFLFQRMDQGDHNPCSGGAHRMAQADP